MTAWNDQYSIIHSLAFLIRFSIPSVFPAIAVRWVTCLQSELWCTAISANPLVYQLEVLGAPEAHQVKSCAQQENWTSATVTWLPGRC